MSVKKREVVFNQKALVQLQAQSKVHSVASHLSNISYGDLVFAAAQENETRVYFNCSINQITNLMLKNSNLNLHEIPTSRVKLFCDLDDFQGSPVTKMKELLIALGWFVPQYLKKFYPLFCENKDEEELKLWVGYFASSCTETKNSLHFVSDQLSFHNIESQKHFWIAFSNAIPGFKGLDMKVYTRNHSLRTIFSIKEDRLMIPVTDLRGIFDDEFDSDQLYTFKKHNEFKTAADFECFFITMLKEYSGRFANLPEADTKLVSFALTKTSGNHFDREFEMDPIPNHAPQPGAIGNFLKLFSLIDKSKYFCSHTWKSWKLLIHNARYYLGTVWAKDLCSWFFSKTKYNKRSYYNETDDHIDKSWRNFKGDFNALLTHFNVYHEFYLLGHENHFELKEINEKFVPSELLDLDLHRIILLKSDTGTGKSFAHRTMNQNRKVCEVSVRIIQSRDIQKKYNELGRDCDHYQDIKVKDFTGDKNFICQLESLSKFSKILLEKYDYFIFDEIEDMLDQLSNVKPERQQKTFALLEEIFHEKHCLLMSANICERTYKFISEFNLKVAPLLIVNKYKGKSEYTIKRVSPHAFNQNIVDCVRRGEKVLCGSNKLGISIKKDEKKTKEGAALLHGTLQKEFPEKRHLLIASSENNKDHIADMNKTVNEYDTITFTPKMSSGVDINLAPVDRVAIQIETGSSNYITSVQMLGRARNPKSKEVIVSVPSSTEFIAIDKESVRNYIKMRSRTAQTLEGFLMTEYNPETKEHQLCGSPIHRFMSWLTIWNHLQQAQIGSRFLAELQYAGAKYVDARDFEKESEASIASKKQIKQTIFEQSVESAYLPSNGSEADSFIKDTITSQGIAKEQLANDALAHGCVKKYVEALHSRDFIERILAHRRVMAKAKKIPEKCPKLHAKLKSVMGCEITTEVLCDLLLKYEFESLKQFINATTLENIGERFDKQVTLLEDYIPVEVLYARTNRLREFALVDVFALYQGKKIRGDKLLVSLKSFLLTGTRFKNMKAAFQDYEGTLTVEKVRDATILKPLTGFMNTCLKIAGYKFKVIVKKEKSCDMIWSMEKFEN